MMDIERNNHRLCEDMAFDKEKIKSLSATVQSLEMQCEELQFRCHLRNMLFLVVHHL